MLAVLIVYLHNLTWLKKFKNLKFYKMYEESCRLCLSSDFTERHEIFSGNESDIPLSIKIKLCSSLTVSKMDLLPKFICDQCFTIVDLFYSFREMCLRNFKKLVKSLQKNSFELPVRETRKSPEEIFLEEADVKKQSQLLKLFMCVNCNLVFETLNELEVHKCIVSNLNPKKKVKCSYCDKTYKSKSQVKLHEKVHEGTQPHKCDYCWKSFLRPSDKVKHERTHTGEQPYSCKICGKTFKQLSGLTVHERYHTKDRPYKCSFCAKSFTQEGTLKKHEKIHAGGSKLFVCDFNLCSKAFTSKNERDLHVKVHFKKKYECLVCLKKFTNANQLSLHMHCPACGRDFDCRIKLQEHFILDHTGQEVILE